MMSTPDDLRADAIEEMELDAIYERHDNFHDERPDREFCFLCAEADAEALAEHGWMGRAVKTWTGGNPYGPDEGREGQPEFNGALNRW